MSLKLIEHAVEYHTLLQLKRSKPAPNAPGLCSAWIVRMLSTAPTAISDNASSSSGHSSSAHAIKTGKIISGHIISGQNNTDLALITKGFEKHFRVKINEINTWRFGDDMSPLSNANYSVLGYFIYRELWVGKYIRINEKDLLWVHLKVNWWIYLFA